MMSFAPTLASFVMMGYTIHVIKQAHAHHRKEPAMTGAEDDEIVREMPFSCDEARSAYITRNDLDVLNALVIDVEDYDPDTDVYTITTQDIVYVAC